MVSEQTGSPNWQPKVREGLNVHKEGSELVILNRAQEQIHQLSETAAQIFKLCDGAHTPAQLARHLCTHYQVEQAQAEVDVQALLDELRSKQLIV